MAQKPRIYLLLSFNTLVLYGLIFVLMKDIATAQYIVLGIALILMLVLPPMFINRALNRMEAELEHANGELEATLEELESTRTNLSAITTLDELTGAYNEEHFLEVLTQHRAMAERGSYYFSVAVVQVDQFADVVDKHGLSSGNEVLQLYTRIVKAALREVDVVSRTGADTFALLLSGATEDDAVMIINRISQLISQIQIADDDELEITNSGGVTSFHGTESSQGLVENATQAMIFAVEAGRDRVAGFLYEPPDEEGAEEMDMADAGAEVAETTEPGSDEEEALTADVAATADDEPSDEEAAAVAAPKEDKDKS